MVYSVVLHDAGFQVGREAARRGPVPGQQVPRGRAGGLPGYID